MYFKAFALSGRVGHCLLFSGRVEHSLLSFKNYLKIRVVSLSLSNSS